jgi:signal peptidase I
MTDATAKPAKTAKAPAKREKKKLGLLGEITEMVKTVVYALLIALVLRVVLFQPYTIPSASDEPNLYRGDYILVTKWSYGWSQKSVPFLDLMSTFLPGRLFFTPPKRGDIVVFKLPSDGHTDFIKRLVGLPGDRIQVRGGQLYINDKPVKEEPAPLAPPPKGVDDPQGVKGQIETNPEGRRYLTQVYPWQQAPDVQGADNTGVYVVPAHCYFMMGDNRDNSLDSRFDSGLAPDDPKAGGCTWNNANDAQVGGQSGVGFVPEENLVGRASLILFSWNTGPDDTHPCCANLFLPWTWFTDARYERFFKGIQ